MKIAAMKIAAMKISALKVIPVAAIAALVLSAQIATAQNGNLRRPEPMTPVGPAATLKAPVVPAPVQDAQLALPTPNNVTPEMWLYSQQLNRHDDPAQAVRRKAELRGAQRMQRIAAMKWYGFSNARPQASPVPMMGAYSPAWIGNGYDRYDWIGVAWPATTLRVDNYNYDIRR